jgi:hypothetical protein
MAAVRLVRERRPELWTGLGVLLHQAGWPADRPMAAPEERALAWLALARRARVSQVHDDPLLERARLAADRIFDGLGRAIYNGVVLAAVDGQGIADWVEFGGGRVFRANTVHFAADLDEPQFDVLARSALDRARESRRQQDLFFKERGADQLPPLPRAFYGPFPFGIRTGSGSVTTTVLYDHDFRPYDEREIEALFEAHPAASLGRRDWVITAATSLEPTSEVLLARIAREYDARLRAGDRAPSYGDDDAWAISKGYPRHLVRLARKRHPDPRLHLIGYRKPK